MSHRHFVVVLCAVLLAGPWVPRAVAGAYHVKPAGSDSASGLSFEDAWRTLAKANAAARPGDRIYVWPNPAGYAHFPNPDSAGSNPTGGGRIAFIGASHSGDPLLNLTVRSEIRLPQGDLVRPYTTMRGFLIEGSFYLRSAAQRCSVSACTINNDLGLDGCDYCVISGCVSYGPRLSIAYVGNQGAVVGCTVEDCEFPLLGVGVSGGNHRFITGTTRLAKCDSLRFLRNRLTIAISDNEDSHPRVHFWTQHSLFAHNDYRIFTKYRTRETYAMRLRDSTQFNTFVGEKIVMTGSAPAIAYFSSDGDSGAMFKKTVGNMVMDSCYINLLGSTGGSRMYFQGGMYGWTLRHNVLACRRGVVIASDVKQKCLIDHNTFVGGPDLGILSFDKSPEAPGFNDTVTVTNNIFYSSIPGAPDDIESNNCAVYIHSEAFDSAGVGRLKSDHNLYAYYGYRFEPGDRSHRWDSAQYSRPGPGGDWTDFFGQDSNSIYASPMFADSSLSTTFNAYLRADSPARGAGSGGTDIGAVAFVSSVAVSGEAPEAPAALELRASPNPARAGVTVTFALLEAGPMTFRVLDLAGRVVHTVALDRAAAGERVLRWNGRDGRGDPVPAGVYFLDVRGSGRRATRRVVMLR